MAPPNKICGARGHCSCRNLADSQGMEGPLLVLKAWWLTGLAIWVYKRWFQRLAPPSPEFEAFCATQPVVAVLSGLYGTEAHAAARLQEKLGQPLASVATLGGFPWPHYRLALAIETRPGAVLLRITRGQVLRARDRQLPALVALFRDVLNELPEGAEAWLHAGAFNNGLLEVPPGGWALRRGTEKRPQLLALETEPEWAARAAHLDVNLAGAAGTAFA